MRIVRSITGYRMSRDYALLWKLAATQSVVCVVDYGEGCRDVAQTIKNTRYVHVSARGITYADGDTAEEFAKNCATVKLEFIVPEGIPS